MMHARLSCRGCARRFCRARAQPLCLPRAQLSRRAHARRSCRAGSAVGWVMMLLVGTGCSAPEPVLEVETVFPEGVPVRVGTVSARTGEQEGLVVERIRTLSLAPDGGVFVSAHNEVLRLDPRDGSVRLRFGQADEGPGQLTFPRAVGYDAEGRIWVVDADLIRIFEEREGVMHPVLRRARIDFSEDLTEASIRSTPFPYDGGVRVLFTKGRVDPDPNGSGESWFGTALLRADGSGRVMLEATPVSNTLLDEVRIVRREIPDRVFLRAYLFGSPPGVLRTISPSGVVAESTGRRYEIARFGPSGEPLPPVVGPVVPPVRLSDAEVERHEEMHEIRHDPRVQVYGYRVPEFKAPISMMSYDISGRLWVELNLPDGATERIAHVFDAEGRLAFVATWPGEVRLFGLQRILFGAIAEDHAWGWELDEFDVPAVVRVEFSR